MIFNIFFFLLFCTSILAVVGVPKVVLRPQKYGIETIVSIVLGILLLTRIIQISNMEFILLFALIGYAYLLYMEHWIYFFKKNSRKVRIYNTKYKECHRVLPQSKVKTIPDTYHLVLSGLTVFNILILLMTLITR